MFNKAASLRCRWVARCDANLELRIVMERQSNGAAQIAFGKRGSDRAALYCMGMNKPVPPTTAMVLFRVAMRATKSCPSKIMWWCWWLWIFRPQRLLGGWCSSTFDKWPPHQIQPRDEEFKMSLFDEPTQQLSYPTWGTEVCGLENFPKLVWYAPCIINPTKDTNKTSDFGPPPPLLVISPLGVIAKEGMRIPSEVRLAATSCEVRDYQYLAREYVGWPPRRERDKS